jgi:small GTP-binding protein
MKPLRILTCGHVDDGKSTLIGRLLIDSGCLLEDQLAEAGGNLAHFTDGLKAERERGITIDIAYRYFRTNQRKFILIDAPGHLQYTRNMVTGASQSDVAILLIDASRGIAEQTIRHAHIANLLGLEKLIVLINKMDLINWSEDRFLQLKNEFLNYVSPSRRGQSGLVDFSNQTQSFIPCEFIPVSALSGANVVHRSEEATWYNGSTLLHCLQTHSPPISLSDESVQFSIQHTDHASDHILCYGTIGRGVIRSGDELRVEPSGLRVSIQRMYHRLQQVDSASAGMTVTLDVTLQTAQQIKSAAPITRGDWLLESLATSLSSSSHHSGKPLSHAARLIWTGEKPATVGSAWILRHGHRETVCRIESILSIYIAQDHSFSRRIESSTMIQENAIAEVYLKIDERLPLGPYLANKALGSGALLDPDTFATSAAVLFC